MLPVSLGLIAPFFIYMCIYAFFNAIPEFLRIFLKVCKICGIIAIFTLSYEMVYKISVIVISFVTKCSSLFLRIFIQFVFYRDRF